MPSSSSATTSSQHSRMLTPASSSPCSSRRVVSVGHRYSQSLPSMAVPVPRRPTTYTTPVDTVGHDMRTPSPSPPSQLNPHEFALRSKLQGVLAAQPARASSMKSASRALRAVSGSHRRTASVTSTSMNGHGDWPWGATVRPIILRQDLR